MCNLPVTNGLGIEENNRMAKTRDLFKKIRDTKGTFHAKMGTKKDRNGMCITDVEAIRRGGKKTEKNCTKKIFMTLITTMCDYSPRAISWNAVKWT